MQDGAERALVARLKDGDKDAFDAVYAAYRPRVFGFLARLCGQRALAEDLLQETFVRLASKAKKLDDDTRLAAWLFTVARNLYLSHRRWMLVDFDRLTTLRTAPARQTRTPFDLHAAGELERNLEAAIAALPVKYREVILLVGVEGLSPTAAADILELKPDAVRQRLRRARDMLASSLGELAPARGTT